MTSPMPDRLPLSDWSEGDAHGGYAEFLASKQPRPIASGIEPGEMHPGLFDFAQAITRWAIRQGRAAIFAGIVVTRKLDIQRTATEP